MAACCRAADPSDAPLAMTRRTIEQMRQDAKAIWQAGVDAVRSDRLVREQVRVEDNWLEIGDEAFELDGIDRIVVLGAGKAGAGMAAGLEQALGPEVMRQKQLTGWINVPADCVRPLERIHLHAARPAGVNEPTAEGIAGTEEILRLAAAMTPRDLCIALISGGGSALLPAPIEGITLADKLAVTRFLSGAGTPIEELNTVRQPLSRIKGGRLAQVCGAGRLVTMIISDILGDPLDLIASGPTVPCRSTPQDALAVLERYGARQAGIDPRVFAALSGPRAATQPVRCEVTNLVIGNNAVAVDAAGLKAEQLGYSHAMTSARASEGSAEDVGRHLAEMAQQMRAQAGPDCLVSGGEPTVKLVSAKERGRGGRNQQLVLSAVTVWEASHAPAKTGEGMLLLSGGTDGEDGPTDAAGAFADAEIITRARQAGLDPVEFLHRNDAYPWFEQSGGLIKTGPTNTNVCDVRVVLVDRIELQSRPL